MYIQSFEERIKNAEIIMNNFKGLKNIDCPHIYKNKVKILDNIYLTKKISENNKNEEIYEAIIKIKNKKYKVACSLGPQSKPEYFHFPNMNDCIHFPMWYELYCYFNLFIKKEKETNIKYYPQIIQDMYYKGKKEIPKIHPEDSFNYFLHNKLIFSFINLNNKGNLNDFLAKSNITNKSILNSLAQIYLSLFFTFKIKNNDGLNKCNPSIFLYEKIKKEGYYHYKIFEKDYYLPNLGFLFTINKFNIFPSNIIRNSNLISITNTFLPFKISFKDELNECFKIENKNELIKCVLLILEKNKIILTEIPKKSKILHTCIL